jgi:hypothetical protein
MPLPGALEQLVATDRFWSDYYGDEVFGDRVAGLPEDPFLELPLSPRHALRVGYFSRAAGEDHIAATSLQLRQMDTGRDLLLGWHDAHRFPHMLRWEDADLIGRLQALREPDLPHPGVPFLLLIPYVASIRGSDHLRGLRLLNRALGSLGVFNERQIQYRLSTFNQARSQYEWRQVQPYGWVCHSEDSRSRGLGEPIYTIRQAPAGDPLGLRAGAELHPEILRLLTESAATRPRFPFDEGKDCMRRARRAVGEEPSAAENAAADPLPALVERVELCYQVTQSEAAAATIPALRDALYRAGLGTCVVFGSWSAFENQDDPNADLDHPNADVEYQLTCYGELAEIVAVVRRVVDVAGRPEVRLYQRLDPESGPPYRRIEL